MHLVVELPELDNAIVRGQHLQNATLVVDKLDAVDLFVQLD